MLADLLADGSARCQIGFGTDDALRPPARLADAGLRLFAPEGPPAVGALLTNEAETAEVLLGAVLAGARVVSLPLPSRSADLDAYRDALLQACAQHGVTEIVARDDISQLLNAIDLPARPHSDVRSAPLAAPTGTGFELVQFTSGSTAQPKSVVLTGDAIEANLRAAIERIEPTADDCVVSWLPFSHDLGLIAMFLAALVGAGGEWAGGGTIVILRPEDFLRNPGLWLQAISHHRGTITAAPDFALRMVVDRSRPSEVDLGSLRDLVVGGEIIRADTLRRFTSTFAPAGFSSRALSPAYGMAEVGVAATLTAHDAPWSAVETSIEALAEDRLEPAAPGETPIEIVACGPALRGYRVEVAQPDRVSRISISGPSMGVDGATGRSFAAESGMLLTGDVGFVRDGQLHVCGRRDDYIVARGRNLYAPAIEAEAGRVEGVRAGRVTAIGTASGDWALVVEAASTARDATATLRRDVRAASIRSGGIEPDEVVIVPPGGLPMTASGKVQRNEVRRRHALGLMERETTT